MYISPRTVFLAPAADSPTQYSQVVCPPIDDAEIAVRTVVISKPHIGTRCLRVRGIKLKQAFDARQPAVLLLQAMSAFLSQGAEPLSSIHLP
jgi:hypothetical protein